MLVPHSSNDRLVVLVRTLPMYSPPNLREHANASCPLLRCVSTNCQNMHEYIQRKKNARSMRVKISWTLPLDQSTLLKSFKTLHTVFKDVESTLQLAAAIAVFSPDAVKN